MATTTRRSAAGVAVAAFLLVALAAITPSASAAGPGQYSAPDWWPLRGSNLVGCARNSSGSVCGGNYHPVWAIDVQAPEGQPIYASGSGLAKVYSNSTSCSGYGRAVVVEHGGAMKSLYAHMSNFAAALNASPGGVWVDENSVIGYVGHTGNTSGCAYNHLHYEETTNGSFWSSATDPGGLRGCIGSSLVAYPGQWGRGSWNGLPGHTFTARHDGTGCLSRPGDGSLVRTPDGKVFRVVGGAPLWISRCDYTSGCAGVINVPNLEGYLPHPRNGALARNVDNGAVYRFAGGAPLWITSCSYGPGCAGVVDIDSHPINTNDHMRAVPVDNTLIRNHANGAVYRFAGGAPQWISSCGYGPGCGGVVDIDDGTLANQGNLTAQKRMLQHPADGTLIRNHADGAVYRFAGGAPLWITSCDYGPKCSSVVELDGGTLAQNGDLGSSKRMRQDPVDGTLIRNHADGAVYRFAGGAPLWITSCDYGPKCPSVVEIDGGTLGRNGAPSGAPRIRTHPADGTYLRVHDGGAYARVAGGAALPLSDCAVLDGKCSGAVWIDRGTLNSLGAPAGAKRLRVVPADGTVLRARPSDERWLVTSGVRAATTPRPGEIQVNDSSMTAVPLPAPPPEPQAETEFRPPDTAGAGLATNLPRVTGAIVLAARSPRGGRTEVRSLVVRGLVKGVSVKVTCTGRGCRRRARGTFTPLRGRPTLSLTTRVRGMKLSTGSVLTVRLTRPQHRSKVVTFVARRTARLQQTTTWGN